MVVAYDTELFGHWWHEGPEWLEQVLEMLPTAGVRLDTLAGAAQRLPARVLDLPAGSWGAGKDWHVWEVPEVLEVQERPDPELGPGQVRIDVAAAGVNFADPRLKQGAPTLEGSYKHPTSATITAFTLP